MMPLTKTKGANHRVTEGTETAQRTQTEKDRALLSLTPFFAPCSLCVLCDSVVRLSLFLLVALLALAATQQERQRPAQADRHQHARPPPEEHHEVPPRQPRRLRRRHRHQLHVERRRPRGRRGGRGRLVAPLLLSLRLSIALACA